MSLHTHDRLENEGPVCKCMDCARKRQERRVREQQTITRTEDRSQTVPFLSKCIHGNLGAVFIKGRQVNPDCSWCQEQFPELIPS